MTFEEYPLLAIDIGSAVTKLGIAVYCEDHGYIDVIAVSTLPTIGMTDGQLHDLEALAEALQTGIDRVVRQAMCIPREAVICVSSRHSFSLEATESVPVMGGLVTHEHVQRLVERCVKSKAKSAPEAFRLSHVIPLRFILDSSTPTLNPEGKATTHLNMSASLMFAEAKLYDKLWQLRHTLTVGNKELGGRVSLPLVDVTDDTSVLAEGLLSEEERQGIMTVMDIGADVTKVVIFDHGRPIYTHHNFKAGCFLTRELQREFALDSYDEAEQIKVSRGTLTPSAQAPRVKMTSQNQSKYKQLSAVTRLLERSTTQQISALRVRLQQDQVSSHLHHGLVLTGGAAQLEGLAQQTESVLQSPVRIGRPSQEGVHDLVYAPHFASLNGLMLAGLKRRYESYFSCWNRPIHSVPSALEPRPKPASAPLKVRVLKGLKQFLSPSVDPLS